MAVGSPLGTSRSIALCFVSLFHGIAIQERVSLDYDLRETLMARPNAHLPEVLRCNQEYGVDYPADQVSGDIKWEFNVPSSDKFV